LQVKNAQKIKKNNILNLLKTFAAIRIESLDKKNNHLNSKSDNYIKETPVKP